MFIQSNSYSTIKLIQKSVSELVLWPESCLPALLLTSCQMRCHLSSYKGHKANKNFVSCALANSAEMQPCQVRTTKVSSTMQIWYTSRWIYNSLGTAMPVKSITAPAVCFFLSAKSYRPQSSASSTAHGCIP